MYIAAKNFLFFFFFLYLFINALLLLHPLFMYPVEYKKLVSHCRRKKVLHFIWDFHNSLDAYCLSVLWLLSWDNQIA